VPYALLNTKPQLHFFKQPLHFVHISSHRITRHIQPLSSSPRKHNEAMLTKCPGMGKHIYRWELSLASGLSLLLREKGPNGLSKCNVQKGCSQNYAVRDKLDRGLELGELQNMNFSGTYIAEYGAKFRLDNCWGPHPLTPADSSCVDVLVGMWGAALQPCQTH
jgi:hypothetical protein